jgi:hypothetical protein
MKAYSAVIVMYLIFSGIIEFSESSHSTLEAVIWLILAIVGIYGILTFIIIEGLDF